MSRTGAVTETSGCSNQGEKLTMGLAESIVVAAMDPMVRK
jgi:hypothetical protein